MIFDVVGTEPFTVEYHKNVHIEKCTFVSRRHIHQTCCRHISFSSKSPGKDILDSNMTTGLMCAADVESTNERLLGNVNQYHTTDRTSPSMLIVILFTGNASITKL